MATGGTRQPMVAEHAVEPRRIDRVEAGAGRSGQVDPIGVVARADGTPSTAESRIIGPFVTAQRA
ncbi:hypothetical protein U1701_08760 [Sphingomonas sp. PB2P19]|uniref:hypothetical protein n=1 Tax=Sphingomonas rhamnosi TaxID=3096156 RepID=UPI002FCC9A4C